MIIEMVITASLLRRAELLALFLATLAILFIAHGVITAQETGSDDTSEQTVFSADMLVVEYTEISIGAASADLFSNIGGTGNLQIKSLWSYVPNRDLRLAFTNPFDDAEGHQLIVGDLTLAFPEGSSGESSFKWTDVEIDWEDGQTIAVSIVRTSGLEQPAANTTATGAPTITGNVQVDVTLTANTSNISDDDGLDDVSYSYQWIRSDNGGNANIAGATASTYPLVFEDQGRTIKVQVSFTDDAENQETLTSVATVPVIAAPNRTATGAPAISGNPRVRETLTATASDIADEDQLTRVFYKYQWLANDVDIQGATSSTYILADEDTGKTIKVQVSFTDDRNNQESRTSAATTAVTATVPTINGVAVVDQTLSVTTSAITDDDGLNDVSYTYQWIRSSKNADSDIAGQTQSTYRLVTADVGNAIKVKVHFQDDANNAETRTSAATTPVVTKPNVIVILVDDLGYNDVSYNGATQIQTTNIDRLASRGITFTNGYVTYPICTPSRAGLLTGRYPSRFGLEGNLSYAPFDDNHGLPIEETLFPERLQDQGYRTGIVGKWQLGAAHKFNPLNRGFDHFFGFLGGAHDYWRSDTRFPHDHTLMPLIENSGFAESDGYLTDVLTDKAIDFIQQPGEDPFFLYLAYNAPHTPLQAPDELVDKYSAIYDPQRRTYLAMVDSLDQNIGRVLDALDESSLANNTVIFFLSDNGGLSDEPPNKDYADNHPLRGAKDRFHEGGIRVPFVASWPAMWPKDHTYDPMVISLDISSTVLKLADATSEDPNRPIDGVDLDPFLRGAEEGPPHQALFWRHWRSGGYAVRSGDDKLIKDRRGLGGIPKTIQDTGESPLLFNLMSDLSESQDLLADDPQTARELASLWNEWNAENAIGSVFYGISEYNRNLEAYVQDYFNHRANAAKHLPVYKIELTPAQPPVANTAAMGEPTISGTPQVGQTLTADTSAISDADGLSNVSYNYQWNANNENADTSLNGATASTHTPSVADVGKTIKVTVSFTDDANNPESLTSIATEAVAATVPTAPLALAVTPGSQIQELDASWQAPSSNGGSAVTGYKVQWKEAADSWDTAADVSEATETGTTHTITGLTGGVEYAVRVMATNDVGDGPASTEAKGTPAGGVSEQTVEPENTAPTGLPTISGTPQVDQTLTADTSPIDDGDGLTNVFYRYQWSAGGSDIDGATGSSYLLTSSEQGQTMQVRVTFTDDADNEETLTSAATEAVAAAAPASLTAAFHDLPDSHDGSTAFTFRVLFSEDIGISYVNMRDDALSLSEGGVTGARRVDGRSDLWEITVEPDDNSDVGITLPANRSCTTTGAICTREDSPRQLTNSPTATVTGPAEAPPSNTSAAGAPTISGTPQVEQTLTADTSSITDEDGLTNVAYRYQWIAGGSDIAGAAGSTYTLTSSEQGKTIQVRVTFTDDRNNAEALTSIATAAVAAAPEPLTVRLKVAAPATHDGSSEFTFEIEFSEEFGLGYAILRDHAFNVTGGSVERAERTDKPSSIPWRITVEPQGAGGVTIELPATTDCGATGAICTGDGRKLSNSLNFTVSGPGQ